ncbi:MAG: ribonuclease E activity regulator RraA [Gammaproteobacteria bacterium]|nr:ribonuclease E activity regulator RraA [Gammaproteobacteria bacterium]MCY4283294.1 ribonuclease E activity regulator RraA [Gammaproteobacteria bacterium]MCY4337956.1 ribonuclease E activity regulator RraA [Gammaproteobacteria bacterium]
MTFSTADLHDTHESKVRVANVLMQSYGQKARFSGPIATVKCFEDNSLVRAALEEPGNGRVLVVDGGGSIRCALVGDKLAALALNNGWTGLVVHGCIRDAAVIATLNTGIKALGTNPRRSVKQGQGERDIPLAFADTIFMPGHWLYADEDGILLSSAEL